jgi:hypothetical protein
VVDTLDFKFERGGSAACVRAELWVNEDPAAYGCPEFARGFPVMRATIEPPGRGYQDLLGWIQVIRAPKLFGAGLHLDSLEMLTEVTHPFGYFGLAPTSFDAPHTDAYRELDWTAHTFLGGTAGIHQPKEAWAALGFSWGYVIRDGEVSVTGFTKLGADAWDADLPFLSAKCPAWSFAPGFST